MNSEKQISNLETEIKAIKVGFERTALTMPIFTKSTSITTTQNKLEYDYTWGGQQFKYGQFGVERLMVTFVSSRGSNTIASLEVKANNIEASPRIQRINYNGGARWVIVGQPNVVYPNWYSTTYDIVVHSMVDGALTVEEMAS